MICQARAELDRQAGCNVVHRDRSSPTDHANVTESVPEGGQQLGIKLIIVDRAQRDLVRIASSDERDIDARLAAAEDREIDVVANGCVDDRRPRPSCNERPGRHQRHSAGT